MLFHITPNAITGIPKGPRKSCVAERKNSINLISFFIFIFFLISWKTFFRHFVGSLLQQLRQKAKKRHSRLMQKNNLRLDFGSFPGPDLWNHRVSTFAEVTD